MTKRGYVSTSNGRCRYYHTNEDCPKLQTAKNIHEWSLRNLQESNREQCSYCKHGKQPSGPSNGHYESLLQAAQDEQEAQG